MVEVGDGNGADADFGPEFGDGADQSSALGAESESVADIFDICAGDEVSGGKQKRSSDAETGVGRVGASGDGDGGGDELGGLFGVGLG